MNKTFAMKANAKVQLLIRIFILTGFILDSLSLASLVSYGLVQSAQATNEHTDAASG